MEIMTPNYLCRLILQLSITIETPGNNSRVDSAMAKDCVGEGMGGGGICIYVSRLVIPSLKIKGTDRSTFAMYWGTTLTLLVMYPGFLSDSY